MSIVKDSTLITDVAKLKLMNSILEINDGLLAVSVAFKSSAADNGTTVRKNTVKWALDQDQK
jgi:hypothetical protein